MPTDLDDYVGKADPTVGGTGKLREQDAVTDHGGYYYNGDQEEEEDLPVTSGYLQEEQVMRHTVLVGKYFDTILLYLLHDLD